MKNGLFIGLLAALASGATAARAEITIVTGHNENGDAAPAFHFRHVPPPAKTGAPGKFTLVDGETDSNSGGLEKLNDGRVPTEEDQPDENFFFDANTPGGRLRLDLNEIKTIQQINTYSWHPNTRAPQVYKVYGATGTAAGFDPGPRHGTDPATCGWTLIASVDTRPKNGDPGGQYGVSITDSAGALGKYRYLLFDCSPTETDDEFGNTFYSEINVLTPGQVAPAGPPSGSIPAEMEPYVAHTPDGKYEIDFDTSRAPDLTGWVTNKLAPVLLEWYPKIVAYLPSKGFAAPQRFRVVLRPGRGRVADTSGTRVNVYSEWVRNEMNGQAIGSVVHECVHVVQQYNSPRWEHSDSAENPGYFVEGIADYYRFFKYEPQTKGAAISRRRLDRANYDRSYRITANFLNWVSEKYDQNLVPQLNAAMREGNYSTNLWPKFTGKTVPQLNTEWKDDLKKKLEPAAAGGG